ncbi:GPI-anchor transamidase subunit T, partial [Tremellales sp. Uapishka_1]
MTRLSCILGLVLPFLLPAQASSSDSFSESLTLHPLPDGRLSVLFEFTTHFSSSSPQSTIPRSHHSLTPPALLLPLEQNNVSELTISFVSGYWDQRRSSELGPLELEAGGGGGEVRGWLKGENTKENWKVITHKLGGLFCAGLGPSDDGESVGTFGGVYPPIQRHTEALTHHLLSHPFLPLCTENLTPFLSLLPSKGISGISSLLAQPGVIFSWGFKTEGVEVVMPDRPGEEGRWRGWWEGVVDLKEKREFSLGSLFGKGVPIAFPEAQSSVLRIVTEDEELTAPEGGRQEKVSRDGKERVVREWDLLDGNLVGEDMRFSWGGEGPFKYPRHIPPPPVTISRTVTSSQAMNGVFRIRFDNAQASQSVVYSEILPWWVKSWMSEIAISVIEDGITTPQPELLEKLNYRPSRPPSVSTTTLHLNLHLPSHSTVLLEIPFSKLTLKYKEHRPDAERGVEIPSSVLTLPSEGGTRNRIYTSKLLLDVPTPDFSMPYNVIIMSSTVMAVFFGLVQGSLGRRWGWVEVKRKERIKAE